MSCSAGFAWIQHDRPVNVFQSTGPTLAWRRQRLPLTEGCWPGTVSTSTFTATPTHPPTTTPSAAVLPELLSPLRSDHTHAALLRSCHCVVQHGPIRTDPPAELNETSWKESQKCYFTSRACVLVVWVGHFSLTEKAMVWNYFLIGLLVV